MLLQALEILNNYEVRTEIDKKLLLGVWEEIPPRRKSLKTPKNFALPRDSALMTISRANELRNNSSSLLQSDAES